MRNRYAPLKKDQEIRRSPMVPEDEALERLQGLGAAVTVQQKGRPAGYSRNAVKPRHIIVRTPDRVIRALLPVQVEGRIREVERDALLRAEAIVMACPRAE